MRARQEDLRAARFAAHVEQIGADAVAGTEGLARDQLVAAHDGLAAAEIDDHVAVFDALDDAVDDLADAILVFLVLPVALGVAHFLDDDLLGRLRRDAAEIERRQGLGDGVAFLGGRVALARFRQGDLAGIVLERRVVDHQQVARQAELAGLAVDLGVDVGLGAVARARRLGDGVGHRVEDDLLVDHLLAGDRVGDLQKFKPVGADSHGSYSFVDVSASAAARLWRRLDAGVVCRPHRRPPARNRAAAIRG